jgi:hypothetical protein
MSLVHPDCTIHRIGENDSGVSVAFLGLASYYHAAAPDVCATLRAAKAANCDVDLVVDRLQILQATMVRPRGLLSRLLTKRKR